MYDCYFAVPYFKVCGLAVYIFNQWWIYWGVEGAHSSYTSPRGAKGKQGDAKFCLISLILAGGKCMMLKDSIEILVNFVSCGVLQ